MLVLAFGHSRAQIKNNGFEKLDGWVINGSTDFVSGIDSVTKNSGAGALKITNVKDQVNGTIVFSQDVPYRTDSLKLIDLSFFIKTNNVIRSPAIWCEVKDHNDGVLGFANSVMQGIELKGSNDWKKCSLKLLVSPKASRLVIGGYQKSAGEVWFDDVEIADAPMLGSPGSGLSAYAGEIKNHIKNGSLFRDFLNWSRIDTDLNYLVKAIDMQYVDLLNQYFIQELRNAGDMHSQFQNKLQAQNYATTNVVAEKPGAQLLKNNIAYLYVPGFGSTNSQVMNKFADTIQQLIRKLDTENEIKGWIVDLRRNSGGNMFPMIAGVGPLTGTGALGYFEGDRRYAWRYEKNGVCKNVKVDYPYVLRAKNPKIAVLVGSMTASSGEMTAISFIGKKNTKLFGQPTGGYVTSNSSIGLSNGAMLILATSYVSDRNKKKYMTKVIPDVVVEKVNGSDKYLEKASEWLVENR